MPGIRNNLAKVLPLLQRAWPVLLITAVGLAHRLYFFHQYQDRLEQVMARSPSAGIWHYLPLHAYTDHFWRAILYLQQTPPIPHLIYGFGVRQYGLTAELTLFLYLVQAGISLMTAGLLYLLLRSFIFSRVAGCIISTMFVLGADLVLLEYATRGLHFYENLAMMLVTLSLLLAFKARTQELCRNNLRKRKGRGARLARSEGESQSPQASPRLQWSVGQARTAYPTVRNRRATPQGGMDRPSQHASCFGTATQGHWGYCALLGLAVAMLALTRASYSYFALIPLGMLLLIKPRPRLTHVLAFAAPVLLLHGGWALKNFIVYDYVAASTSTWKGCNFAAGLERLGMIDELRRSIGDHLDEHPAWYGRMVRQQGVAIWNPPFYREYVPPEVRQRDVAIAATIMDKPKNSVGQRLVCQQNMVAYWRFVLSHPGRASRVWSRAYAAFWLPPGYFLGRAGDPFRLDRVIINSLDLLGTVKMLLGGGLPEQAHVITVKGAKTQFQPTRLPALQTLPHLARLLNLLCVHLLAPGLLLLSAVGRWRRWPGVGPHPLLLVLVAVYVYAAVVHNLPEYEENMRFRLNVGPVVWLISAYCLKAILDIWQRRRARA